MSSLRCQLNACALGAALLVAACADPSPRDEKPVSRFESAKREQTTKATAQFCEKSFKAGERRWVTPRERALPSRGGRDTPSGAGWTWVNLWASWCGPCVKEMPLFDQWSSSLARDGLPVKFEFWSVDADGGDLAKALRRPIPGQVRWLASEDDLPAVLEQLGVPTDSPIPVHALIDGSGYVRCVRVGSVGDQAFGAVKAILAGG
jgi:thiol-disulfide isomerase/thioredoxin